MKIRDAMRISWFGLTASGQRLIALAMVATLMLACAAWCSVAGLLTGSEKVSQYRIEKRPLPFRLLLGGEHTRLHETDVADLAKAVRDQSNHGLKDVSPFRVLAWNVGIPDSSSPQNPNFWYGTKGRTINSDHHGKVPSGSLHVLVAGLELADDRSSRIETGVFVCPRLLSKLQINDSSKLESLVIDLQLESRPPEIVKILGVLKRDPPEMVYFLCPEPLETQLLDRPKKVRLQPLDPAWFPDPDEEKALLQIEEVARDVMGISEANVDFPERRWISLTGPGRPLNEWTQVGDQIRSKLPGAGPPTTGTIPLSQVVVIDAVSSRQYHMVSMYFREGRNLPQAVSVLADQPKLDGKVDRTVAELVVQLESFSAARLAALTTMQVILAFMCGNALLIIQVMRCAQRRHEAAMLRVMGMSPFNLVMIAALDGFFVWLVGSSLGLALGMMFGVIQAACSFSDPREAQLGYDFNGSDIVFLLWTSLLITVLSALMAAYFAWLRKTPADMFD